MILIFDNITFACEKIIKKGFNKNFCHYEKKADRSLPKLKFHILNSYCVQYCEKCYTNIGENSFPHCG